LKIIMGLGNPGSRYEGTRHNIGFKATDQIAHTFGISINQRIARSLVGRGRIGSCEVVLAQPKTYMNHSGEAAASLLSHYRLTPSDLVVIQDDLDLPLEQLRIKTRGGHGGHKGIESIRASLGTDRFIRLKIGIGRPAGEASEYVLSRLSREEKKRLEEILEKTVEAAVLIVNGEVERAMNRFNQIKVRGET
jgi:peptidyl-tRNA hydrolase, PTH1 family